MLDSIPNQWLYPADLEQAAAVQRKLVEKLVLTDSFEQIRYIAGMDVSNNPYDETNMIYATTVLLHADSLQKFAESSFVQKQDFPYIPGFLGFREAPALIEAFKLLPQKPDLLIIDGHGISHPRSMGIASHLGALLDLPSIGVAKSILVGKPAEELGPEVGDTTPLVWKGKTIGMLLRSKKRCLPLIVSPGHKVCLSTAVNLVQSYLRGYRLPEPTRFAHMAANACRRTHKAQAHISHLK